MSSEKRGKSALASEKVFGKRTITPTKNKLNVTMNTQKKQSPTLTPKATRQPSPKRNHVASTQQMQQSRRDRTPQPIRISKLIDQTDVESLIEKLIKNRQQICSVLQLYDLLFANGAPNRCLVHNNFTTLYCQNQQKLLCVNCVYGNIQHKLHRVTPVKNVMAQIALDVESMSKKIIKIMDGIDSLEQSVVYNLQLIEEESGMCLRTLDIQFDRIQKAIHEKYAQIKATILDNFTESKLKHEIMMQEIRVLKDIYADHTLKSPRGIEDNQKIYRHVVLNVLLNDSEKFDDRMLKTFQGEEMRTAATRDIIRIRQLCESTLLGVKPQPGTTSLSKSPNSSLSRLT